MGDGSRIGPLGRMEDGAHIFPVRVYFEDTDLSGVVYHANYLRWMERARSDFLLLAGIDQRTAFAAGEGVFAVADLTIRYLGPARLDDDCRVVTRVLRVSGATTELRQEAWRGMDRLIDARVTAAYLTLAGRPQRQPREWIDAFRRYLTKEDD